MPEFPPKYEGTGLRAKMPPPKKKRIWGQETNYPRVYTDVPRTTGNK